MVLPNAKLVSYHVEMKRIITRRLVLGIADGIHMGGRRRGALAGPHRAARAAGHRTSAVTRRTRFPHLRVGNRVHFQGRLPEACPVCTSSPVPATDLSESLVDSGALLNSGTPDRCRCTVACLTMNCGDTREPRSRASTRLLRMRDTAAACVPGPSFAPRCSRNACTSSSRPPASSPTTSATCAGGARLVTESQASSETRRAAS